MRLQNKIAIVVGAGQGPGTGMGNGRATVIRFAQEGAKVLCVDKDLKSAEETAAMAAKETNAGECAAYEADVTREASMKAMIDHCKAKWGRVDILHYNVGFSIAGGDAVADRDHRGSLRPHHDREPARHGDGGEARAAGHARAEVRRDPRHLLARRVGELSLCGLQGLQGRDGDVSASRSRSRTPATASAAT